MRVELGFLLLELGEFWRLVIHSQEHINGVFRAGEELNMSRNYDDQLLYMSDFSFLGHCQISIIFNYFGVR